MKMWNKIIKTGIPVVASLLFTTAANAIVVYPALDIQQMNGDGGVFSDSTGLTMDATAITVINSDGSVVYDFTDQTFYLTSDVSGSGTLSIGDGSLLTASFSNLELVDLSLVSPGSATFNADLIYTGGSMAANLQVGRIEGAINVTTGSVGLGIDFTADSLTAKVGEVQAVPVPAAVWLFGSGLLGLVGMAKRKKAA
ncbi:MAG TPA: VPLPA-CTERM sorting domain-containing protein [Gammaproteobacteria bacterium]|nr:VPLPA-CTERM sorting domain-containing protein [Gammaproteobacteria bacterium]